MFERYSEKARRVIFFARYEASQFGSPLIESEHLLLGLLREDKPLVIRLFSSDNVSSGIRKQIENQTEVRERVSTSVDLPLSNESKRVLKYAADQAGSLGHRYISTGHLYLGLLCEENCLAATILKQRGVSLEKLRTLASQWEDNAPWDAPVRVSIPLLEAPTVRLHGRSSSAELIRRRVEACRANAFHWEKKTWTPRDIVLRRGFGTFSFDLALAQNPEYQLVKGGWTRDHCAVCSWELSEGLGEEHATGYTNGRDWLCLECYERFWLRPDFFAGGYNEVT